jgi:predicted phosphodiesterase
MAGKPHKKRLIAAEYIGKYPNAGNLSIAKLICADYPLEFKNIDQARTHVRILRGRSGDTNRKTVSDKSLFLKSDFVVNQKNPFGLPEPIATDNSDFILPNSCTNILWLSDIHIPNHDIVALTAAIKYGLEQQVNCVVIGGDLLDNTPFTRFDHKPTLNDARQYFEDTINFLNILRNTFPKAEIFFMEGNHDHWYTKWLMTKAPMLFTDSYYQLEERLMLNKVGIKFIKQERLVQAGKLFLAHGHTLIRGVFTPVNGARGIFLRGKSSCLIGHVHSTSNHSETNLKGDIINCYTTGCLCVLHPDYDPHNTKHNQGFAHITINNAGQYRVNNIRVVNGEIY